MYKVIILCQFFDYNINKFDFYINFILILYLLIQSPKYNTCAHQYRNLHLKIRLEFHISTSVKSCRFLRAIYRRTIIYIYIYSSTNTSSYYIKLNFFLFKKIFYFLNCLDSILLTYTVICIFDTTISFM